MDIQRALRNYKKQMEEIVFVVFSVEAMVKATKPTRITGPLFLAKKYLAKGSWQPGRFFIDMKTW